ncbi:WhiB family transcriptional regulator [Streptomyces sp. NPDC002088]|uniref:WhiB family transcriptional regulator n=1 Tax=Streptomyces sp. NPDC002088 TaxID=3154665 RepID=UPI00331BF302
MRAKKGNRPLVDLWAWQREAACRDLDSTLFYSPHGEGFTDRRSREERARSVCWTCAVQEKCAQFALTLGETYGVWGGLTEAERRRLARRARSGLSAG